MPKKDSAQEVIENYKKKQQWGPFVFGALAVLLVVVGVFIVVFWLTGDQNKPLLPFLASNSHPNQYEHSHSSHTDSHFHQHPDCNNHTDNNADANRLWTF